MRELREFRVHHEAYRANGIELAGVGREPPEANRRLVQRHALPYPMLSDAEGLASRALGIVDRLGIGGWNLEFFRRTTILVDVRGIVSATWVRIRIRGHAAEVLELAKASRSLA